MVPSSKIDSFISKVEMGVQWFNDAGALLVRMLDEDPDVFADILQRSTCHWLTLDVLKVFELIGRRKLAVEAMFMPPHVLKRLIDLPVEVQQSISTKSVPVAVGLRDGRHHVTQKPAAELTRAEAGRVLGPNGLVPPSQQVLDAAPMENLGRFTIVIVNNKPFIKRSQNTGPASRIVAVAGRDIDIELFVKKPA
jgi:hypothetical protein